MKAQKRNNKNSATTLSTRILDAAPDIRVEEIVYPARLRQIPANVRRVFAPLYIEWAPNRAWGSSFQLGADRVTIGHRRGDHLATFPWLHDLAEKEAERLLRLQIAGTLLHELGHAIFDLYLQTHKGFKSAAQAAIHDGAPSTYRGQDVTGMSPEDLLHEMFAEAFRYWCHNDPDLRESLPAWTALAEDVVNYANTALK